MAASSRRAVLTGIGVVSSIGLDAGAYWESLLAGRSGIRKISLFDTSSRLRRMIRPTGDQRRGPARPGRWL